jgi:hypothetical protein
MVRGRVRRVGHLDREGVVCMCVGFHICLLCAGTGGRVSVCLLEGTVLII